MIYRKSVEITRHKAPVLILLFSAIILVFISLGIYFLNSAKKLSQTCTETVSGVVAENVEVYHDRRTTYAPVFEYKFGGRVYREQSSFSSNPPKFTEGEEIVIHLNPENPTEYFVEGDNSRRTLGLVFTILGSFIAAFGAFFMFHNIMEKREALYEEEEAYREKHNLPSSGKPRKKGGIRVGVMFLLIGLFSAAIPIFIILTRSGDESFFYVTTVTNGISSTKYSPISVIAMLAFSFLFAITFIVLGIVMIKKRSLGFSVEIGGSAELDTRGNVLKTETYGTHPSLLPRIYIAIGSLMLVAGMSLLAWDRISLKSLVKTEAAVSSTYSTSSSSHGGTRRTYYADIEYILNRTKYKSRVTVSSFFNKIEVTVYVDPKDPYICRLNNEYLIFYLVLLGGGLLFLCGGLLFRSILKKSKATQ